MKLLKFSVTALLALGMAFLGGCSDDDGIDNRDQDYGYVQFKLHKEASYDALSRAQKPQLDYLSEASKVQVSLYYDGTTITQSLTLSAPDKQSAEFGLRSEKLRLLTGQYQIITFSLFNADDELIYNGMPGEERLDIVAGGLVSHDLTVDVEPRGTVLDLQGLVGLHRDARGDARRRTAVHLRRDRVPRPDRKAQDDQRAHHVRKTPREVLDPLQGRPRGRGSRGHRGRLPDLLARMRHAALAQGGRLQPGEIPGLRQEQSPAGDQQASQEPGFHHRGQQDHRGQSRRHALRGRRVYPRLLRALRNLEGARRGALVLQG